MRHDFVNDLLRSISEVSPGLEIPRVEAAIRQEFGGGSFYVAKTSPESVGNVIRDAVRKNCHRSTIWRRKQRRP